MNALLATVVPALGWALVDFLWQGALVGVVAAAVLLPLKHARPQVRYAVLLAALLACVSLPAIGLWRALAVGGDTLAPFATGAPVAVWTGAGEAPAVATAWQWRESLGLRLPQLVAAWAIGSALLALRFALGLAWVGRMRSSGSLPGFDWQARLERVSAAVGLAVPPQLRLVDGLDGPAVAGWWRPVVLMPAALATRMPTDLIEALLAHELAHVVRHDYLVNLLQGVVESLLFYHPVVWWLSRRIRIEREQIADDLALRAIAEPRHLALALQRLDQLQLEAVRDRKAPALSHLAPAAHGGHLMNRIHRLLRPRRTGVHWSAGLPLLAIGSLCLAVYAHAMPPSTPVAQAAAAAPVAAAPEVAPVAATPRVAPVAATPKVAPVAATPRVAPVARTPEVAPVAPAAAAPRARSGGREGIHWSPENGQPYALVRAGQEGVMMAGDMSDLAEVKKTRSHLRGDFLWFRRDGKAYVVQDPALLREAREAWAPAEAMGKKMEAVAVEMKPYSQRMETLGKQMRTLSEADRPQRERMEALSARMQPVAERQQALGAKMAELGERMRHSRNDDERESLARDMQSLQAKMEPLNRQMTELGQQMGQQGQRMNASQEPMRELGEQMREAGEPMRAIGERMRELGEQQEVLAHEADAKVQSVIERALRSGKAERSESLMSL